MRLECDFFLVATAEGVMGVDKEKIRGAEMIPLDVSRMESNFFPSVRIRGVDRLDDARHDGSAKEQALMRSRARLDQQEATSQLCHYERPPDQCEFADISG
jgi:hypothetical protein